MTAPIPARGQTTMFEGARKPGDDPDYPGTGHACWKCRDGELPCVRGHPHRCEYPRARND